MNAEWLISISCAVFSTAVLPAPKDCTCARVKHDGGWCAACEVGYVAGVRIRSALLFEVADAHGHDIIPDRIKCETCKKAMASDGYCERCRMGFVDKQAYMSRLTYHVAKGRATKPANLACGTCRVNAKHTGWCDACRRGMIGHIAIDRHDDFVEAAKAYRRLVEAVRKLTECETCAVAQFTGGQCLKCKGSRSERKTTDKPRNESNDSALSPSPKKTP